MRAKTLLFTLLLFSPAMAVQAPTIAIGDFLFVQARVIDCGPSVRMVEFGEVDENGEVTLFENISISAEGRAIHQVVNDLLDALEKRSGYRSKTVEITRVPGSDIESIAKKLMFFVVQNRSKCPNYYYRDEVPNMEEIFRIAHNKAFKYAFPGSGLPSPVRLI